MNQRATHDQPGIPDGILEGAAATRALPFDIRVGPGPDGAPWVIWTVCDSLVTASVRLPPDAAEALAAEVGGALRKAAVEARRARSGLVIPSEVPVSG